MFRKLALVAIGSAMAMTAAGCRDNGNNFTPVDLSSNGNDDMAVSGGGDMTAKNYMAATLHDIDTGTVAKSKAVTVTDVIAVSTVTFFKAKNKTLCRYEVFVQDPACTTGPCGLVVEVDGPAVANNTCPRETMSGTVLANVKQGDKLTISGTTDSFSNSGMAVDGGASGTVVQHSIDGDTVTITASAQTLPAPQTIVDPSIFVPYTGSGWAMYEGMRVILNNVTAGTPDAFNAFNVTPGNAHIGNTFDYLWRFQLGGDAGVFPPANQHFTSITGVVNSLFGGSIEPTGGNDFVYP